MNKFIAYFDYLGFKEFINNNNLDYQKRYMSHNFRDIESSLAKGNIKPAKQGGLIADLSESQINCINFSDTVVFWTNDDSDKSLIEILDVADRFNWQAILYNSPVRGSVVYGEIARADFQQKNSVGGTYNINSVFGKGLVQAHEKAEKQHWAGTVIDDSFINELFQRGYNPDIFLKPYAKKYKVPYKNHETTDEEFVMNIIGDSLDSTSFKNVSDDILRNFSDHNKSIESKDVQEKLSNTLKFLESYCVDKE